MYIYIYILYFSFIVLLAELVHRPPARLRAFCEGRSMADTNVQLAARLKALLVTLTGYLNGQLKAWSIHNNYYH